VVRIGFEGGRPSIGIVVWWWLSSSKSKGWREPNGCWSWTSRCNSQKVEMNVVVKVVVLLLLLRTTRLDGEACKSL
jgi:hypothetical protein